jgi:hypothetical protein
LKKASIHQQSLKGFICLYASTITIYMTFTKLETFHPIFPSFTHLFSTHHLWTCLVINVTNNVYHSLNVIKFCESGKWVDVIYAIRTYVQVSCMMGEHDVKAYSQSGYPKGRSNRKMTTKDYFGPSLHLLFHDYNGLLYDYN